ncbi:MAG: methylated-DNA--[protein]-cysteine S-methyltransferase [Gordonia sp. (in: high G+C Gram-positive bacteria)]
MTAADSRFATIGTPDGPFTVIADAHDVVLASGWTDDPDYLLALIHRTIRPPSVRPSTQLGALTEAVSAYYAGQLSAIDAIAVRQRSGPFLEQAWQTLRTLTPGEPASYRQFAELAGEPNAIRAAASACARNAAALFVPCHRVVRSDGSLGGFRYGLTIKQSLLAHESEIRATG